MRTRQPIITVLGHVDSGKTTFLDKVRGTAIAEKEAGAITQHIGATEVPIEAIKKISGVLTEKYGFKLEIPGLLFVDTPGHEAFINLRKRGGSIADLAVVVVDVTQGIQKQTIEAIEILKNYKTLFIVALNKIDKLHGYESKQGSFSENIKKQSAQISRELEEKLYTVVGKLHELGFQSERFDRCENFTKQVAIVPVSAKTGEGFPECLTLLAGLSQKFLREKLFTEEKKGGRGNVLEVREERGLGKTADIILFDGMLSVNDKIVLAGKKGIIETKIRALLKPKPLEEIGDSKEKFLKVEKVFAASGVKIIAPELEEALAGSPIMTIVDGKEKQLIAKEISGIRSENSAIGPIIKADTLGALEAITLMLETQLRIKPKKTDVGEVTKKDVMEVAGVKEENMFKAVIFAFNVKTEETAIEEAKKREIKIFQGNIIYRLLEEYTQWEKEQREIEKSKRLEKIVFPAKIQLLPNLVFRNSKPAIVGIKVLKGKIKQGAKLMKSNGTIIGRIVGIQLQNKSIAEAKQGEEVAISISDAVVGRNLFEDDILYSFISEKQLKEIEKIAEYFSEEEKELLEEIKKSVSKTLKQVSP